MIYPHNNNTEDLCHIYNLESLMLLSLFSHSVLDIAFKDDAVALEDGNV
jgi:hypothetical protein